MSVICKIDDIPIDDRKKMLTELRIKTLNPRKIKQTVQFKMIEFDMFEIIEDEYVAIPFSYYLHHFNKYPNDEKKISEIKSKFQLELFDRQKEIRPEIFDILNQERSIILSLFTGYGKTLMAIYIACKIGLKTLVIDHRVVLTDQWENSIQKACGNTAKIQVLTAKSKIDPQADFYIINAINVPKRELSDFEDIGLLIMDEAHLLVTEKYSKALFYVQPKYLVALTATPVRTDGKDRVLEVTVGPNIIYRSLNAMFNVYLYHTNFIPKVEKTERGDLNWNSVLESQSNNEHRNNIIIDLVRYFCTRNILVLCKRKDHAELLCRKMKSKNIDADTFMGSKRVVNFDCRVLLATYSKGGVGFDNPKLDMLIVAGDVEESWIQYLGRVFRKEYHFPIIVDLIDKFRPLQKHSNTRTEIYKNSGGYVKNLNKNFPQFEEWRTKFN